MDKQTAIRLYNLIPVGHAVGASADGDAITSTPALTTTLQVMDKPTYIGRIRLPDGVKVRRTLPNGTTYEDAYDWDTKLAAKFLREWADALDPPPRPDTPTKCAGCASEGFAPSTIPGRCEFCDGTEGGVPPC